MLVCVCLPVFVCRWVCTEVNLRCHSQGTTHLDFEAGPSLEPRAPQIHLNHLLSESQDSACLCLHSSGLTNLYHHAQILHGCSGADSGPYGHTLRTILNQTASSDTMLSGDRNIINKSLILEF